IVMSDSEDSTVTYTTVSSPFGGMSGIGSPRVDGPPMILEDPYAYVVAAFQAPPSPNYVLPVEEQPLPAAISPTADSLGYILESDPEEDPANYPADGGDDDDDDESSDDDEDDDDDVEEDEDDEEEHPALADSILLLVGRLLAIPTPPPSTLSPLSSPLPPILSPLPQILLPPLPVSSPPLPASPTYLLGYRAAMIQLRAETSSTSHPLPLSIPPSRTPLLLPILTPTSSPPLLLPFTDYRVGISEVTLLPQKRLCITLGPRYEVREISYAPRPTGGFRVDYGFDDMVEDIQGTPAATDVAGLSHRMIDFVTTVRHDTYEIYVRLDDAQDDMSLMSGSACGDTKTGEFTAGTDDCERQQGPARGPAHPEIPEEAGSSS
ncbi:hypothetical protein Tco_1128685, partial [Tanacetum coccineum]